MTERDRIPSPATRAELQDGGGRRHDYGPRGCAGFVAVPVLAVVTLLSRQPKWGSPAMKRAIRKHDRQHARKYGGPKPPRQGCWLMSLVLLVVPAVAVSGSKKDGEK